MMLFDMNNIPWDIMKRCDVMWYCFIPSHVILVDIILYPMIYDIWYEVIMSDITWYYIIISYHMVWNNNALYNIVWYYITSYHMI